MLLFSDDPVFKHSPVSISDGAAFRCKFLFSSVAVFRCFCFPVFLFSDVPIFQLSCILVFRFLLFSDVPVFQCSCFPVFLCFVLFFFCLI